MGILCGATRELQQCMAPLMTPSGDDVMEVSLLRPDEEESGPSPTPEEEATLLGEGDGLSGVPGPTPQQVEIPRFIEPDEQTTTPVTSTAPCSHPSWKGKKSCKGIDVDPNNSGQCIQTYLERDNRLQEWWEEFFPLVCSMDGNCNDAQVKSMAHHQAVAFCLPATQKEVHSTWITPPCLAALGRKECLGPIDPKITKDYQEVQRKEMVVLAIVLQRSAIHAGTFLDVFCGAVHELHNCLVPVVEEGDLFNMEKEIWGVRKDPIAPSSLKRAPPLMPRTEEPTGNIAPKPPPMSKLEGDASPDGLALVLRMWPLSPPIFLPWTQMTLQHHCWGMCTGRGLCPLGLGWISPPWSHCKWPSHIHQWLVRSTTTFRPRVSPWGPCPALPLRSTLNHPWG